MERVVALRGGGEGAVIPYDLLAERRVVPFSFAGRELVALYEPGTASALDSPVIAEGRDVGATGVFVRSLGGQPLDLSASADGGFVDAATGSVYDILGRPSPSGSGALGVRRAPRHVLVRGGRLLPRRRDRRAVRGRGVTGEQPADRVSTGGPASA